MSKVVGKFSLLKENKEYNLFRYRECDFFLDESIKERNKIRIRKNTDFPISLKLNTPGESDSPTIIFFYFNSTDEDIKREWERVPLSFKDENGKWLTKKKYIEKNKTFDLQEEISFNFGFVNLDYENKLYETFKNINKFNPFHWAKIRNTDKNYFVIYYNRLYPQNFIKGDFSRIKEKFAGREEGKILKFKILETGENNYFKDREYGLCCSSLSGKFGKLKILDIDDDGVSGKIKKNRFSFEITNRGTDYKKGTSYFLGDEGVSPGILEITDISLKRWKEISRIDNSNRMKKFRAHTNHVTFNEGFFQYIGENKGLSVTVFDYGNTRNPTFTGEHMFYKNQVFESIGTFSGLDYNTYTGVSAGLIYFAGVCREVELGTSVYYIHGTSLTYINFRKIEISREKEKKSEIYKKIKKIEGRKTRKLDKNIILDDLETGSELDNYLKNNY